MNPGRLKIRKLDVRSDEDAGSVVQLRECMSPKGDVVSDRGRELTRKVFGRPLTPQQVVEEICGRVEREGIDAVLHFTAQLDGQPLTENTVRVPQDQLRKAHAEADESFLNTIRRIRGNIYEFQTAILHDDVEVGRSGVRLQQRYTALKRVGLCVPGGAAAYPSTVLMTAVPAQAAGVSEIVVVAPPTEFGANNPDLLATCHELDIDEVYRVGGAQGVAAMAYGASPIERVDMIAGPGNLFVALAKRLVYGQVEIDAIAGPSEVVVIAQESARADYVAADLLAQAEHAPGASLLVTWSEKLLEAVAEELERQVGLLSRSELTVESLEAFGALILVRDEDQAVELTNLIAPEHLHIASDDAERLMSRMPCAGATFLGDFSPVAIGDYAAGPSHVLPTSGTARFASGLTSNDFRRGRSVIHYTDEALRAVADDVRLMADKEGLTAHRASVDIRLKSKN